MQILTNDYVVGLVDGEGSFTVYIQDPHILIKKKRRVRAEPKFFLKLIAQDKNILYELKKFFGCGAVYFQKEYRENHQQCYRYEVSNRTDLQEIIIPFFKNNPLHLFSKKKDFRLFCKLFEHIQNGVHLKEKGLRTLFAIKAKMH